MRNTRSAAVVAYFSPAGKIWCFWQSSTAIPVRAQAIASPVIDLVEWPGDDGRDLETAESQAVIVEQFHEVKGADPRDAEQVGPGLAFVLVPAADDVPMPIGRFRSRFAAHDMASA